MPKFKSIDDRKKQLKESCLKCLKEGHYTSDYKSAKRCVYWEEFSVHHRSLCTSKFEKTIMKESVHVAEESEEATQSVPVQQGNTCLSIGETVLIQYKNGANTCVAGLWFTKNLYNGEVGQDVDT